MFTELNFHYEKGNLNHKNMHELILVFQKLGLLEVLTPETTTLLHKFLQLKSDDKFQTKVYKKGKKFAYEKLKEKGTLDLGQDTMHELEQLDIKKELNFDKKIMQKPNFFEENKNLFEFN